jgi:hypothetical protein
MKNSIFFLILILFFACGKESVKITEPQKEITPMKEIESRILANIHKMDIPKIEALTQKVQVKIWGSMPDSSYILDMVEIIPMDTGISIKIWLSKTELPVESNEFVKEIEIKLDKPGGNDIEVIGANQSLMKLIFLDELRNNDSKKK